MNAQRLFLLIVALLFCLFGCDSQRGKLLLPDNILFQNEQPLPMESSEIANIETSFQQNLLPILSARCAYVGCHIAGGPKNLDFSTYPAFIQGGDSGPIFIPGNAQGSPIIGEIVSGRMPIGGPRLTDAEIQLFTDWINNQKVTADRPVAEPPQIQTPELTDHTISFEQHLSPILNARCAYAGCHDAKGPDGLNFSTYQTFIRGGEDGPVFEPGNPQSSDIIEEIVSGRMPPGGPRLPDAQIQLFIDWINQQEPSDFDFRGHYDDDDDHDDHDDDDDDDHDDDHDDDDDDNHDDDDDHDDDHDDDDHDDDDHDDDDDNHDD